MCWRYQTVTLLVAVATLALTVFQYDVIPKGFFPVQDTGVIQGISQAPQTIGSKGMATRQQELANVILSDPAVESVSSFIGADGTNTTTNSGRLSINLKPLDQRDLSAADVIRRLEPKLDKIDGIQIYMQPVQNITVDDRVSRTQYQYTLEDPDQNELNLWTGRFVDKLKQEPGLEDVATDQQTGGLAISLVIDRVTASRLGIAPTTLDNTLYDAFGQRQINTMYTQLNQYHVILEAMPQFQVDPNKLNHIFICANAAAGPPGGRGSFQFVGEGLHFGWIERSDRGYVVYPIGEFDGSSRPRDHGGHHVGKWSQCRRSYVYNAEQPNSTQCVFPLRDHDGTPVDYASGSIPVHHRLL